MRILKMRTGLAAGVLVLGALWVAPLSAYDGLQKDFGTCLQGSGKVANSVIVAACSRLIDNAKTENELIGFAYAMRATVNSDKASNCRDAKKVMKLVKAPAVVTGAKEIIAKNC